MHDNGDVDGELLTRPRKSRKPVWAWRRTNEIAGPCSRAMLLK